MNTSKVYRLKHFHLLLLLSLIVITVACEESNPISNEPEVNNRGDVIESNLVITYSPEAIDQVLASINIPFPYELTYSVQYITITYQTIDQHGNLSRASGGLYVPVSTAGLPILSLQHGTEVKRENVASTSALSSVEATTGLLTGAIGYITAVPDYIGFGVSTSMHPYIHAESLTTEVIDFIRAVKIYCANNSISLNDQLFLAGYSEGGYASLAAQKDIEQNYSGEFQITAVAPIAGPYDLAGTLLDGFQKFTYPEPAYIAYLFTAYNEIYGWDRLDDFITTPYSSQVTGMFDGSKYWWEVTNLLPDTMEELLKPEFIEAYLDGSEPDVQAAFEENTLLNWSPAAPICFIHGTADQIVPFKNTQTAYDNLSANSSAEIKLIPIEGGTHESSGIASILLMLEYFEGFREELLLAKLN